MPPTKSAKGTDSHCLICGADHYDLILDICKKCGGRCVQYNANDMYLMERRQTRGEIRLSRDIEGT